VERFEKLAVWLEKQIFKVGTEEDVVVEEIRAIKKKTRIFIQAIEKMP
jgi:hypothetical protein